MGNAQAFDGAKVALMVGEQLVVILRDTTPGLAFAGCWDLPGGGREGDESPFECVRRECKEEIALDLAPDDIVWQRGFAGPDGTQSDSTQWFFAARMPKDRMPQISLGEEGQCWRMMSVQTYIAHKRGIPRLQERLQIAETDGAFQKKSPRP